VSIKKILKDVFYSFYWLIFVLVFLDQLTKGIALKHLADNRIVHIIDDFLTLKLERNTGAAFSILQGNMVFLAILSAVAGAAMIAYRIYARKRLDLAQKIIFAIIIAGTFGNFIDRAFYSLITGEEGVVDFISFTFGTWSFPTFNVADMCLTLGVIAYVVLIYIEDKIARNKRDVPLIIEGDVKETVVSEESVNEKDINEVKEDEVERK
jgi:signal peptidase II